MNDTSPRYRIQAVSELTGVATATLRAWERRYGFPIPMRSNAAYRLYSEHDVTMVTRMQSLIASGMAPNEAARSIVATGQSAPIRAVDREQDPFAIAVDRIVEAATRLDTAALSAEIRRALMLSSGLVAFEKILSPALVQIGMRWHRGELSVASEHVASHLIAEATLDLLRMVDIAADAPTVLMACFAEELHVLPLYGAALELASWGYRPIIVGARTPPQGVARAIEAIRPSLVGLSVTVAPEPASAARELCDGYADACRDVPFCVGGAAAEELGGWVRARGGVIMPSESAARRLAVERLISGRAQPKTAPTKHHAVKPKRKSNKR